MIITSPLASSISRLCLVVFLFLVFFSFPGCTEDYEIEPRLNTIAAADADITATSAILKGEITYIGNMKIIEYGIELSSNQLFAPSTVKSLTTPAAAAGSYQVEFTGLTPNTLYYYKAYVLINTARLYSQNVEHFTTKPGVKQ